MAMATVAHAQLRALTPLGASTQLRGAPSLAASAAAPFSPLAPHRPSTGRCTTSRGCSPLAAAAARPTSAATSPPSPCPIKAVGPRTAAQLNPKPFLAPAGPEEGSPRRAVRASASPATQQQQRPADADVMGLLLRQRIVFLGAELNDFVADAVVSQLLLLDAQDPKRDIRLFINSPGGSISATMAIFDAINLCRADVSTIAFGLAASTAAIVLAAGTKGKRFAMPNTRIMMHQPMGGASGQAIDVEIQAKEIMYHKNNLTRIVSQITGVPFEKVEKDLDRDRYMSPMEAVEYGVIDGVIDEDAIIPLQPTADRVKPRQENLDASKDPRRFLIPQIPDSEIF